jgi:glycerol-3-phosphate dehydrogenase
MRRRATTILGPEPYDLVVIGGGITGAGIARDAALRGLRVALFEKDDYASGTSSRSSKLVHGGLRYLEHGEIGLVFESVNERRVQTRIAPHLVRPLRFLVPVYRGTWPGLELMNLGLWIYDALALFRTSGLHRTYRGARALACEPQLEPSGLRGAIEYYDCVTDDARLVLENLLDAISLGAHCHSYTEVVGLTRGEGGRVEAVEVRDRASGARRSVPTRAVVVAAGPWTTQALTAIGLAPRHRVLRPTKGVHVVFPREVLALDRAVTMMSPLDGRVLFAIPWGGRTVVGTTDTDFTGDPDQVHADAADVHYLCTSARAFFPRADLRPDTVLSTWAGLRPLINDDAATTGAVSREHEIFVSESGIAIIAGGKLTTYRIMARQVVDAAARWLKDNWDGVYGERRLEAPATACRPLPGAVDLPAPGGVPGLNQLAEELARSHRFAPAVAAHLCQTYGGRARDVAALVAHDPALGQTMQADLPHIWAEVVFAARRDLARTVEDTLARRLPLLLLGRERGLDVAARVAELMAAECHWSAAERDRHLAHYRGLAAQAAAFRGPT